MLHSLYKDFENESKNFQSIFHIEEKNRSVVDEIINLEYNVLMSLDATTLLSYGFVLSQYALFLQHKFNECQAFLSWSDRMSSKIIDNDRLTLNKWVRSANLRMTRLSYLTKRIETVIQCLRDMAKEHKNVVS